MIGDRIAIMAEGRLRCCGSSLFLKRTYGVGYQLTIEKLSKVNDGSGPDSHVVNGKVTKVSDEDLKAIVTGAVKDATVLSNVGTELSFQLPLAASGQCTKVKLLDFARYSLPHISLVLKLCRQIRSDVGTAR